MTTETNDEYVDVNGLRLRYRRTGDLTAESTAPVALVLPGLMGHVREWDVLVGELARYRPVVAMDHRGHGRSQWASAYPVSGLVSDVVGLLRALDLTTVDLIGHSLGGLVGARCAAERPDLVRRLVMIDIGPDSLGSDWGRYELPQMLTAFAEASYSDEDEAVATWLAGDPLAREPLLRHYVRHALTTRDDGRLAWRFDAAGFRSLVAGLDPESSWAALDRITAPTLLVRGEHSELLNPDLAAVMLRRLGAGRLVEIPGGGHDLGVQQPEAVAAAVHDFLTGREA